MPFGSPEVPRMAMAADGSRIESSLGPVAIGVAIIRTVSWSNGIAYVVKLGTHRS